MNPLRRGALMLTLAGVLLGWATAAKAERVLNCDTALSPERFWDCANAANEKTVVGWRDAMTKVAAWCRLKNTVTKRCLGETVRDIAITGRVPWAAATQQQAAPPPSGEAQRVAACLEAMRQFHQAIDEATPGADEATKGMTLQQLMQSIGCASPSR